MGQLIRSTTTSFEAIRFSQNARLVPSDQVDIERRKAIAATMHSVPGGLPAARQWI